MNFKVFNSKMDNKNLFKAIQNVFSCYEITFFPFSY